MTLTELCDVNNCTITCEYSPTNSRKWTVTIKHLEIKHKKEDSILVCCCGFGENVIAAVNDMISLMRGRWGVVDAYTDNRREFKIPDTLKCFS